MAQNNGKFVCYFRVSTGRQGKSGLCLEAQREAVKQYLNGGDWETVAEHTDVESGKNSDRPALEKELADARLHRASLVVSKVDRLTRSVAFLSRLLEAGVDVRFADLPQSRVGGRYRPHYIAALQAAGARTLRAIADSLNARRIPTVRGAGQ
jgi:hypothetical protein